MNYTASEREFEDHSAEKLGKAPARSTLADVLTHGKRIFCDLACHFNALIFCPLGVVILQSVQTGRNPTMKIHSPRVKRACFRYERVSYADL